jgi:hypothetical protein
MPQAYVRTLLESVDGAVPALLALADRTTAEPLGPGKWSPREVIGHLIDSATNNHRRFVTAQAKDDLVFDGYDQDHWVDVQRYRDAAWPDLVMLWAAFNRHLARVMALVPEAVRLRSTARHNLDRLAWQPLPADSPATLDYFMNDYVGHLRHHLAQILGAGWDRETDAGRGAESA